jgi:hypothetical protein
MKLKLLSLTGLLVVCAFAKAQVTFSDATSSLNNNNLRSGVAMAITDMNKDGLDDIIRLDQGDDLEIEYQQANGTFILAELGETSEPWGMVIADADKNGFNDIIVGGVNDGLRYFSANDTGDAFTMSMLGGPNIFLQNANFADIDNDGNIDYFGCHDNGLSSPYKNDGNGNFSYDLGLISAESTVPSDDSGNYGSIWTDYDNDGDLDLYISKCRQGVDDPMDGRRLNLLFQNDGNGNFTDVAESAGLLPMTQTWSTNFEDLDNDGDYDVVMVNHFVNHQVFENNGDGTFTDITNTTGIESELEEVGFGIQIMMEDFDNDTFVDFLMTTTNGDHRLFYNNGDMTFTVATTPFSTNNNTNIQSAAVGDVNNDGFIDVIAGYANGFNSPSNTNDQLFINDGNGNNWTKINLEGNISNINGIGARVEIYGEWGMQVREIRAGESYGTQNSLTAHFGLGAATEIDEIIIYWPSGEIDTNELAVINETIFAIEGEDVLATEEQTLDTFKMYPNPATAQVSLFIEDSTINGQVIIRDIQGREVITQQILNQGDQTIDVQSLSAGVYFIQVGDGVQKLIKK